MAWDFLVSVFLLSPLSCHCELAKQSLHNKDIGSIRAMRGRSLFFGGEIVKYLIVNGVRGVVARLYLGLKCGFCF